MSRNFVCPETDAPCMDGGCTIAHCCERDRLRVNEASEQERANRLEQRRQEYRSMEALRKLLRSKISN
jgi:hypothetical protein